MLHYLDMEEILKLYRQDHEHTVGRRFETRQALDTLTQRFELPAATNFKQLLKDYDMKYATVRSYLYNNRTPVQILVEAALEGNIQALYNQLKLYPKLREKRLYTAALGSAAQGGHEAIIELMFELGAEDMGRSVFISAVVGGQLALVLRELSKDVEAKYIEQAVRIATKGRHKAVVAALLDYSTAYQVKNEAMAGAGESGDNSIVAYVISRGCDNYKTLVVRATAYGHFDIVKQYWHKLSDNDIEFNDTVLYYATKYTDLNMVKFVIENKVVNQKQLDDSILSLKRSRKRFLKKLGDNEYEGVDEAIAAKDRIIEYLKSKRVVTQDVESSEESTQSMSY